MHNHQFFSQLARILNSNQSRSMVVCGNVYDLFFDGESFVPLIPFLCNKSKTPGLIQLVYELNGPIRVLNGRSELKDAWISWKAGMPADSLILQEMRSKGPSKSDQLATAFEQNMYDATGNTTLALEFLRQLTIVSREGHLQDDLIIIVEAADMMLPTGGGDVASLNERQLRRVSIVQDWFCDPSFLDGNDSVILIAESRSLIHPRISKLPQVLSLEIASPTLADREQFIEQFIASAEKEPQLWGTPATLAALTAGLSIHAVRQLLAGATFSDEGVQPADVVEKVEAFIQSQLGEDVVEFKKPSHTLEQVVGFARLKGFIRDELIPRFRASGDSALPGAAVAGPIGGGKTFIFEAVAGELDVPVLVLKNIRSQWFGQTDVIFERLRRMLEALDKVVIFVDEADTQFGGVGAEAHSTERRLTGKIQAMMSDPRLRGRVAWLLMTARIHLLSPDIRRPGRVGDLIIPVLDPTEDDRRDFLRWVLGAVMEEPTNEDVKAIDELTKDYSAASFATLRSNLKAHQANELETIVDLVHDQLPADIGDVRRYQTLQALMNCSRRSLLPDPEIGEEERRAWFTEIKELEATGIR